MPAINEEKCNIFSLNYLKKEVQNEVQTSKAEESASPAKSGEMSACHRLRAATWETLSAV
jgi:hypothetical protein